MLDYDALRTLQWNDELRELNRGVYMSRPSRINRVEKNAQHVIVGSRNLQRVVKSIKWDKLRRCRRGIITFKGETHSVWEKFDFWTDLRAITRGAGLHYLYEDALNRSKK